MFKMYTVLAPIVKWYNMGLMSPRPEFDSR